MNHYDGIPDTTVYLDTTVSSVYAGPGPGVCGCTLPTSCGSCRGDWMGDPTSAERKQRVAEVTQQWRSGRLTAREFYHLSAALSYDGLPDREAARAVAAAESAGAA